MNKIILSVVVILVILTAVILTACSSQATYWQGETVTSAQVTAPTPEPPQAPSNLEAVASTNHIDLYWNDNSNDEQGYRVYRDGSLVATLSLNTIMYQDIGLSPANTYNYKVTAFNQIGESGTNILSVRTLNPPAIVRLDGIGVYDNGEDFLRDIDGGEIYLGMIVTDGERVVKTRLPTQEGQFFYLYDEDTIVVGTTIFSTNEVGDYLRIAVVGYESDGGTGERFIYDVLGDAAESYLTGGATSLLGIDLGFGDIIGAIFGAEDDWLGSFERAWYPEDNWGTGTYTDICCYEQDGTPGLRLWFTIETY